MTLKTGCKGYGCLELVESGELYCADCRPAGEDRPSSAARGYGRRWRRFRAWYLDRFPKCVGPGMGRRLEDGSLEASSCPARDFATEVDHLDGEGPLGPRGFDPTNMAGRCKSCHSTRTAREQKGG